MRYGKMVTPSPSYPHQRIQRRIAKLLCSVLKPLFGRVFIQCFCFDICPFVAAAEKVFQGPAEGSLCPQPHLPSGPLGNPWDVHGLEED